MNKETFIQNCLNHNLTLSNQQIQYYETYMHLLVQWNKVMNLTAIVEEEQVWDKHFMDCLYPTLLSPLPKRVADIGSGAGFPGLVWAIAYPNCEFTLIEPTGKRCQFLNEVIQQLHLRNVKVINKRSEDCKEYFALFDAVSARAVANLPILLELCTPLLKVGGVFYALKGSKAKEELESSKNALKILGCQFKNEIEYICEDQGSHITLLIDKVNNCDLKYPRNFAQIKKKPL